MKRWIHATQENRIFKYPEDIAEVEAFVAENYNPNSFTCVDVCDALEKMYSNLESVPIETLWIERHPETNHQVCLVKGDAGYGCNLIDPTGDQFLGKTEGMKCAAFHKRQFGYLSNDYVPMYDNEVESEFELYQYYPDARLITL